MITITPLSNTLINPLTKLISAFQLDHFQHYGGYYALKEDYSQRIEQILSSLVRKRNTKIYIALIENQPAGYIFLRIDKNIPIYRSEKYGYISGIFVKPLFRKQGIAQLLLVEAERWFKKRNIPYVELKVDMENNSGQNFWEKAGFKHQQMLLVKKLT